MANSGSEDDRAPVATSPLQGDASEQNEQMLGMSACMDKFARSFEASARRWELIVYPLLFAFVLLAAYGFYLIYELTNSVMHITANMDVIADQMVQMSDNMGKVTDTMTLVAKDMHTVTGNLGQIMVSVGHQDHAMASMSGSLEHMTNSVTSMSATIYQMRYDTAFMGQNLQNATGPMRFMNTFMPW